MPVENEDRVRKLIGRWDPSDLALICSLRLEPQEDHQGSQLVIQFAGCRRDTTRGAWPSTDSDWFEVTVRFQGVRSLNLREFGAGPTQIMGFSIHDISS